MLETVGEVFPDAKHQRFMFHFYRNLFSVVPRSKVKLVAKMLKTIHAHEGKKAAREKAKAVVAQLWGMMLKEAAKKVENIVEETLAYCDFPMSIGLGSVPIMCLNSELRNPKTHPCSRHILGWEFGLDAGLRPAAPCGRYPVGQQKYMNMKHLEATLEDVSIAG